MRQHNYRPQQNEPDEEIPVVDIQNRRQEAYQKTFKIALRLILSISFLNLIPSCIFVYSNLHKEGLFFINPMEIPNLDSLKSMSANLQADPILEVQIIDYGSACPSGFSPLKLATWPGTVAGCLCDNGDFHNSTCEKVNSEKCKKEIPSTFPVDMYEWEDSVFCVKKAVLGTEYLRQAECPAGYKECYPGGCFKGDCPVTKLEITSSLGEKANKFASKQDKYLVTTKTQGELPLINIQISLGDIPCFTQDLFTQTIKNSSYTLSPIQENSCDKYGLNNQFTNKLDTQTAYEFFTQNSFPYFPMHLPYFEENANSTTSFLSSVVRIKTAYHDFCLNIDVNPMTSFLSASSRNSWRFYLLFVTGICVFQLVSLICLTAFLWKPYRGDPHLLSLPSGYISTCYVVLLACGLFWYFNLFRPFKMVKEDCERFSSLKCFEGGQGSLLISNIEESIKPIDESSWTHLGIVFLGVLYLLVIVWYSKQQRRIDRMRN